MSTKEIIGGISFGILMTGIFSGNLIQAIMIGEINRRRQDGNLVSYFGFTPVKNIRIVREYRDSYPNGKLYIYHLISVGLMVIGLAGVMVYILASP
jgi:hypothetical protein